MAATSIKEQVYQEFSRVTQAISNSKRMELIDVLPEKLFRRRTFQRDCNVRCKYFTAFAGAEIGEAGGNTTQGKFYHLQYY